MIETIIASVAIVAIVGGALAYIIIAKKKGNKCIGCPDSATCGKSKNGCCCHGSNSEEN